MRIILPIRGARRGRIEVLGAPAKGAKCRRQMPDDTADGHARLGGEAVDDARQRHRPDRIAPPPWGRHFKEERMARKDKPTNVSRRKFMAGVAVTGAAGVSAAAAVCLAAHRPDGGC